MGETIYLIRIRMRALVTNACRVMAVFSALVIPVASAAQGEGDLLSLSNDELARHLFDNSAIAVPIELGCNRRGMQNAQLPVHCLYENIEVKIEELQPIILGASQLFDGVAPDTSWRSVQEQPVIRSLDWEYSPDFFWREIVDDQNILCGHGRPRQGISTDIVDCLVLYSTLETGNRLIRIRFWDAGIFRFYNGNASRNERRLHSFVQNFVLSTRASDPAQ